MPTRTQRKTGRPAKRWEDDLNEFVTDEETEDAVAEKFYEWENKE